MESDRQLVAGKDQEYGMEKMYVSVISSLLVMQKKKHATFYVIVASDIQGSYIPAAAASPAGVTALRVLLRMVGKPCFRSLRLEES